MKKKVIALAIAAIAAIPTAAPGQGQSPARNTQQPQTQRGTLAFYDQINWNGHRYEVESGKRAFQWDYHPRSIGVHPGDRWEICARPRFAECIILDRSVPDAEMIGIPAGRDIGSVRPAPTNAPN